MQHVEPVDGGIPETSGPALAGEVAPTPRLAQLWVAPGGEAASLTPVPQTIPPARPRNLRRAVIAAAGFAATAALAVGAGGAFRARTGASAPNPAAAVDASPAPASLETPAALSGRAEREAAPAPLPAPRAERTADAPRAPARATRKVAAAAARAASPAPIAAAAVGLVDPAPADRRCVPRALRARLGDRLPAEVAVRFPVEATGAIGRIDVLGDVGDREVTEAIQEAIRGCAFVPGAGSDGHPTTLPVVMRIRFAAKTAEPPPAY